MAVARMIERPLASTAPVGSGLGILGLQVPDGSSGRRPRYGRSLAWCVRQRQAQVPRQLRVVKCCCMLVDTRDNGGARWSKIMYAVPSPLILHAEERDIYALYSAPTGKFTHAASLLLAAKLASSQHILLPRIECTLS